MMSLATPRSAPPANPRAGVPDFQLWLACAQASDAAYELDAANRAAKLPPGAAELVYVQGAQDARALVCRWQGKVILAFQGTQFTKGELPSIFENICLAGETMPGGAVLVAGYLDQLRDLARLSAIDKAFPFDIVTGHSMGAAIAELCGLAPAQFYRGQPVISIAAPKVATAATWQAGKFQPTRIVRERDFAPLWPPLVGLPFCPEWEQAPGGLWWIHDAVPPGSPVSDVMCAFVPRRPAVCDSVADHSIDLYVADLKALAA
jgi:hypothetical protein